MASVPDVQPVEIAVAEAIGRVAELARDLDRAVHLHLVQLLARDGGERAAHPLPGAAAPGTEPRRLVDADAVLAEQAEEQAVRQQTRIERSEERRVGQAWISKCRSRWWPDHYK